jgi:hypothetical protein
MHTPSLRFASLLLALYLPACGAGDDDPNELPPFEPPAGGEETPAPSPEPTTPVGTVDQPPPEDIAGGEEPPGGGLPGLSIDGQCRAVCTSAAVDPDADGWGWENEASCVVPGSVVATRGTDCAFEAPPPPPPVEPPPPPDLPTAVRPEGNTGTGFFTENGRLYDRLGNDFVIRGINHPVAWYRTQAQAWMEAIADTGANTVRIVWETVDGQGTATPLPLLRDSIASAIELDMIPMVELHDVTGETTNEGVIAMADYYASDAVREILLEFEDYLLVNIANEWSGSDFANAYEDVITVLRNAGVNHTLVIDSNGWGQTASTIFAEGPGLLDFDPQHNLLFSVHMYEEYANRPNEENGARILNTLRTAVNDSIPLIVGEFGWQHGNDGMGNPRAIPFEVLMSEANRLGIGYIAWSWTGNSGGVEYLDLTNTQSGMFTDWGSDIVEGPSADILGIRGTSLPASVFLSGQ